MTGSHNLRNVARSPTRLGNRLLLDAVREGSRATLRTWHARRSERNAQQDVGRSMCAADSGTPAGCAQRMGWQTGQVNQHPDRAVGCGAMMPVVDPQFEIVIDSGKRTASDRHCRPRHSFKEEDHPRSPQSHCSLGSQCQCFLQTTTCLCTNDLLSSMPYQSRNFRSS